MGVSSYCISNEFTLKCLRIGTPKAINFPFVSNGKFMVFRCPNSPAHCNEAVIYLNGGTPKNNEFSIWNKWKIYFFFGVPILKHIRVCVWVHLYIKKGNNFHDSLYASLDGTPQLLKE